MDEKHRVALPKRIREDLEAQPSTGLFLTPWNDESLALYTEETLTTLAARLSAASPTSGEVRAFSRLFYARAERVELDDQGRFRIPAGLVKLAGLGREVTLVGVQDHLEIWNRERWEEYLAGKTSDYDRIAEQAFNAGPPR